MSPKDLIGSKASGRKLGVVICTCADCKLSEFLDRINCGVDFEFVRRVSGNIVDIVLDKNPNVVIVHTNGGSYSDWGSIIDDLNTTLGTPIVVLVSDESRVKDFVNDVDMTILEPRSYSSRIQFASSLFCLANGAPPAGSEGAPMVTSAHEAVPTTNKRLLRLVEWTLALSLLLSSLVAMVVLLVKEDVHAAATAFATIFSSTIAAFTSGGVIRLLRRWKQLQSRDLGN